MRAAEVLPRLKEDFGKKFRKQPSLSPAIAAILELDRSSAAMLKRQKPSKNAAKSKRRRLEATAVNAVEIYREEALSSSTSRATYGQNLIESALEYAQHML